MPKPRQQLAELGELRRLHAETECDALARAEEVGKKRHVHAPAARVDNMLEQKCRTTSCKNPPMDLGDLMHQGNRRSDTLQKAARLEAAQETPEIGIGSQWHSPVTRRSWPPVPASSLI